MPETTVGFSADNYGDNATGIPFVLDDAAASVYGPPAVATPGTLNVTGSWLADDLSFNLASFAGLSAIKGGEFATWTPAA